MSKELSRLRSMIENLQGDRSHKPADLDDSTPKISPSASFASASWGDELVDNPASYLGPGLLS
jgi:hypothetical protein